MKEKFSLKDALFNLKKVEQIASELSLVYPPFKKKQFIETTVKRFPELELKQRIGWIREQLQRFLPVDFRAAAQILLDALPPPLDETLGDDDFGDFIYAPYADFIAQYGCNTTDLYFSLRALRNITMRFSAEDAIRYFLNAYPNETLHTLSDWALDPHYHVRRLVSEGTRPKLPWAQKLTLSVEQPLPLLSLLYSDPTRFVTRSVANHLNDISKTNPALVLSTLQTWQKEQKQTPAEMTFIINHSLRTLVKLGHPEALRFLNFTTAPAITVSPLKLTNETIQIGDSLEFGFSITATKQERLLIDYILYFQNKKGELTNKKVFKIKQCIVTPTVPIQISKRHPLRAEMTTRTFYPGLHRVEIQINGRKYGSKEFHITSL